MKRLRILRDDRGASIVEMGLAAPILATLLVGMIDLSRAYSTRLQLEQVAQRTIEKVQISEFKYSDLSGLETEAATAAGTGATAHADAWLECNGVRKNLWTDACTAGQSYARYVEVEVTREFEPYFNVGWFTPNANGDILLTGTAGVRVQ
jgi:Flp pilus assembly pilin Flp